MITLLQTQQPFFTDADRLTFSIVWGILSIISANILLHVWKEESKPDGLTLLSYLGAAAFGTLMAPVISTLALLGWLGTITPKDAKRKILSVYNGAKEAVVGHWRLGRAKQAPPHISVRPNSGFMVHPNLPSLVSPVSGPYLNDLLNVKTRNTSSLSTPPPPGPPPHVGPYPNFARGTRNPSSGPNLMTRLSNGSGAPSWYVPPPAVKAKKAAPKM